MKKVKKILAALLSIILLLSCLPMNSFASGTEGQSQEAGETAESEHAVVNDMEENDDDTGQYMICEEGYSESVLYSSDYGVNAASADYEGTCGQELTWYLDTASGTLTISGSGDMEEYLATWEVPWSDYAESITDIVIEQGVTSISQFAFWSCRKATSVSIGNTVKSIGLSAFGFCSALTSIQIPASVTSIALPSFNNCDSMAAIEVDPENTSYSSRDGVLFNKGMTSLICYPVGKPSTQYTVPASVTSIESGAFTDCLALEEIAVESGNTAFCVQNGVLYNAAKTTLVRYPVAKSGSSFTLPETVKRISDYGFYNCGNLTTINLGNNLTTIGNNAFGLCVFSSLTLPDSLTSIGMHVFWYCRKLESIVIPENVTSIPFAGFWYCTGLKEVEIPAGVTTVGDNAFRGCSSLESIYFYGDAPSIENNVFTDVTATVYYPENASGWENIIINSFGGNIIWKAKYYDTVIELDKCNYCEVGDTVLLSAEIYSKVIVPDDSTLTWSCSEPSAVEFGFMSVLTIRENTYIVSIPVEIRKNGEYTITLTALDGVNASSWILVGAKNKIRFSMSKLFFYQDTKEQIAKFSVSNTDNSLEGDLSAAEKEECVAENISVTLVLPTGLSFDKEYRIQQKNFKFKPLKLGEIRSEQVTIYKSGELPELTKISCFVTDNDKVSIESDIFVVYNSVSQNSTIDESSANSKEELNEALAVQSETVEIESGTYPEYKITEGQKMVIKRGRNVKVNGTLTVSGELEIEYGASLEATNVEIIRNGRVTLIGTMKVAKTLKLNKSPCPEIYIFADSAVLEASKIEVLQGFIKIQDGNIISDTLLIDYSGAVKQWAGNLVVKSQMKVTSSWTSEFTDGVLWLNGKFNQGWHNGNFKASDNHVTVFSGSSGDDISFGWMANDSVHFNHFLVNNCTTFKRDENFAKNYVYGDFYSAEVDLDKLSYKYDKDIDPQHTWETGLRKVYDTTVTTAIDDWYLQQQLSEKQYNLVRQSVLDWLVTATSPFIKSNFDDIKHRVEYLEIKFDSYHFIVFAEGLQSGQNAALYTLYWYGGQKNGWNVCKDDAHIFGISTATSINEFKRQAAVYLAKEMVIDRVQNLGKEMEESYPNTVTRLVKWAIEVWEKYDDIGDIKDSIQFVCDRVMSRSELPEINLKSRSITTVQDSQKQNIMLDNENVCDEEIMAIEDLEASSVAAVEVEVKPVVLNEGISRDSSEHEIDISDSMLLLAIRQELGMKDDEKLSELIVSQVTELDLSEYDIVSLTGLEAFISLEKLNLRKNNIYDVSPLRELTELRELDLGENRIMDIEDLGRLSSLQVLSLEDNMIESLYGLENLTGLIQLNISGNPVKDFSGLESLSGLEQLDISKLTLPDGNLNIVKKMKSLSVLYAGECGLLTIQGLNSSVLQQLDLSKNQLSDLENINLTSLKSIDLRDNPIDDLSSLSGSEKLMSLNLESCQLTDDVISELTDLIHLERLSLKNNYLTSVDFTTNISHLLKLDISGNKITDLAGFSSEMNLQMLIVENCNLTDMQIEPISRLRNLEKLDLSYNSITDVTFIISMNNLEYVDFSYNDVDNIDILSNMNIAIRYVEKIIPVKSLEMKYDIMHITTGSSCYLHYYTFPYVADTRSLEWSSSNTKIVSVDENGKVTGLSKGKAIVTVTSASGKNTSCAVFVDQESVLQIDGTNDYSKAFEVLDIINQEREANGLNAVAMDEELLTEAMQRAAECAVNFSHTSPDGTRCSAVTEEYCSENIAAGSVDASSVMDAWMNSEGHRSNILDSDRKSVGVGCFYHNGIYFWVQLFGRDEAVEAVQSEDKTITALVPIEGDEYVFEISGTDTIDAGNTSELTVTMKNPGWDYVTAKINPRSFNWTSSNDKSATVSNGIVTGISDGMVTITAAAGVYNASIDILVEGSIAETVFSITGQPTDITVMEGETAVFQVAAEGKELTYQWQYCNAGTSSWKNSGQSGNRTDRLSVPATAARNGQKYRCVITDASGDQLISDEAVLYVEKQAVELAIVSQPKDYTGEVGETAVFAVAAEGENLSYQWQYCNAGSASWKNSGQSGNRTDTLSVPITEARNGQKYRCVVTDGAGNQLISDEAVLHVKEAEQELAIISQPENYTGEVGGTAVFTVTAAGNSLSYQWEYQNAGSTVWKASGQSGNKTDTLKVPVTEARDGQKYRCVITDINGNSVTSDAAVLHVGKAAEKLTITGQPNSYTGEAGETAVFTVAAAGNGLSYQWEYQNTGSSVWKASGQSGNKTNTLKVPITEARDGQKYRCVITDGTGNQVISDAATLYVGKASDAIVIIGQPEDYTGAVGDTAVFTVTAVGEGLSYQWEYRNYNSTVWKASGQSGNQTDTLQVPITAARNGQKYRCVVTDADGNTVTSDAAALVVE